MKEYSLACSMKDEIRKQSVALFYQSLECTDFFRCPLTHEWSQVFWELQVNFSKMANFQIRESANDEDRLYYILTEYALRRNCFCFI